jgi:hypothetical protein
MESNVDLLAEFCAHRCWQLCSVTFVAVSITIVFPIFPVSGVENTILYMGPIETGTLYTHIPGARRKRHVNTVQ